jgi:hypothetical protein
MGKPSKGNTLQGWNCQGSRQWLLTPTEKEAAYFSSHDLEQEGLQL